MSEEAKKIEVPENLGDEIGGNGRVYFENVVIDNVLDALLELTATVWSHRDHIIVLEKVLAAKGIDVNEEIEAYMPNDEEIAERKAERDELVNRVFGSFLRRPTHDLADKVEV